jgi:predicted AlkP superfamily phosphohydrolase/phosphomutase
MAARLKFGVLVCFLVFLCSATNAAVPDKNVILIGWDGAQREHVMQALEKGRLPRLKKLSKEGKLVNIDIEGTTDTKAGWSQILTGYYPTVTGVYSNSKYQAIPEGLTIGERLEKYFGDSSVVTMAVIGKKGHVDDEPEQKIKITDENRAKIEKKLQPRRLKSGKMKKPDGKIIDQNGVQYYFAPAKPYYNMSRNTDLFENGLKLDEKVGERAIELVGKNKNKRFFFFVHFAEVDHSGHQYGENSKEYNDALISNDKWTGKIIDKLKKLGIYKKTLIYITADHGFDEGQKQHSNAPYVFLATNAKNIVRDGRRQDVAPTILEGFGLDLSKIEPKLDGIPLTKEDNRSPAKIGPIQEIKKKAKRPKAV